jgi:hypothetical protein
MAKLSQNELKVIKVYFVKTSFETFRTVFILKYFKSENANVIKIIN